MSKVIEEYRNKLAQAEKCIYELKVLKTMYYDPFELESVGYLKADQVIKGLIREIEDNFC